MREPFWIDLAPSEVVCEPSTWSLADGRTGVLMRLSGPYRHGSAGTGDAHVISLRIDEACELTGAAALVIDARDLAYEWGDDRNFQPRDNSVQLLPVVQPEQFASLAPIVGAQILRTDLEAALDEVERPVARAASAPVPAAKTYVWTEVWMNNGCALLLRAGEDGTYNLCHLPERPARPSSRRKPICDSSRISEPRGGCDARDDATRPGDQRDRRKLSGVGGHRRAPRRLARAERCVLRRTRRDVDPVADRCRRAARRLFGLGSRPARAAESDE